jgi:GT2 family glycosyltransferase
LSSSIKPRPQEAADIGSSRLSSELFLSGAPDAEIGNSLQVSLLKELASRRQAEVQSLKVALGEVQKLIGKRDQDLSEVTHQRNVLAQRLQAIESSLTWRVTLPLRRIAERFPLFRRFVRGVVKLSWWTVTGTIVRKLRERRIEIARILSEGQPASGTEIAGDEPAQNSHDALIAERERDYQRWIEQYDTLTDDDLLLICIHIARLTDPPVISVVMPVYEPSEQFLREAIASVKAQLYPYWELCICDDASPSEYVARVIRDEARGDPRIRWVRREVNGHICAATNDALALATGDYVALMDHDDLLPRHALYSVAVELVAHPEVDMLFTDEDRISDDGRRHTPYFKPGWNPELLLAQNFVCHLGVYRRSLMHRIGGLRVGFEGSQDHDLALRASAAAGAGHVKHLPGIFYHWRLSENQASQSFSQSQMDRCLEASRLAITEHLNARGDSHGAGAFVGPCPAVPIWSRVHWPLPPSPPKVSIIVPTRDYHQLLAGCAEGILNRTDYPSIELIIADNDSVEPETLALFERLSADPRVRIFPCPGPFNYSAINNAAVRASSGEIIVLLNNDIEIIGADWLKELVSIAIRPEVGAVGAKLLYASGAVQHAGVVLGIGRFDDGPGVAGHFAIGEDGREPGYFGQNVLTRDLSAVTAACIAIRRDVFEMVGGLDERNLAVAFNDVDFCIRVREKGLRIIWTPYAEMYHLESASRGSDQAPEKLERFMREGQYMRDRWSMVLDSDPFYNPVFSRLGPLFSPTRPVRPTQPWRI